MTKLTVIRGGRSAAQQFEAIVRPHYDALYRAAFRLTRAVPDAEDLVQEVCVRAYPRLDELAELDNPRAWLLRVMQRLFIDQTRRYERRHVESLDAAGRDSLASDEPGPVEQAEWMIRNRWLESAWHRLDKEQRVLLALHDIEGYSLAEMVEMTGLKDGTLKSCLHRARVKLGRFLQFERNSAAAKSDAGAAI